MASYLPPLNVSLTKFVPQFWEYGSDYLTYQTASSLFLSLNGNETIGGLVRFAGGIATDSIAPIASGDVLNFTTTGQTNFGGIVNATAYYINGSPWNPSTNPAGSNTQIQYNNNNAFGANANLTYNSTNNVLNVGQSTNSYQSTCAMNVYGNMNISNQFAPGQQTYASYLYFGGAGNGTEGLNGFNGIAAKFANPMLISCTSNPIQMGAGSYIQLNCDMGLNGGSATQINFQGQSSNMATITPSLMSLYNGCRLSMVADNNTIAYNCSVRCFNGSVPANQGYNRNLGNYTGWCAISTWNNNGNWSYGWGVVRGNGQSPVLSTNGTNPSISGGYSGGSYITIGNNSNNSSCYYCVWVLTDGANG